MDNKINMNQIKVNEIYNTVIDLEGPKYPLDNMNALNEAGEYILNKLKSYGVKTEVQEFYVKGFDEPFRNIVGLIGDQSKPAIVIGSHYDTVRDCPGANDNLSAVAVSLEVARVLSKMDNPPTVIIAAFTLEEKHPGLNKALELELLNNNLHDEKHRFTSANMLKFSKRVKQLTFVKMRQMVKYNMIFKGILNELKDSIQNDEIKYLNILINVFDDFESEYTNGALTYSLGSQEFVKRIKQNNTKISNIINFDCLGWISDSKGTQKILPVGEELKPMIKLYKTEFNSSVGNYIGVMGDKNSQSMLAEFLKHCESAEIEMPYFGLNIPLEYNDIKRLMSDTLRSDHAPFWQAGIPGIFVSDTANFRSDYYHTGADTSDRLDYDSLGKITLATIKTILSFEY